MQPFHEKHFYRSAVWPEFEIYKKDDRIIMQHPSVLEVFSSAVYGGGLKRASHFVNWKVPFDFDVSDPVLLMKQKLKEWECPAEQSIGLQTAANILDASIQEMNGDAFRMICCVTAGVGNSARAGTRRETFSAYQCGTINTFLFIDGNMTHAAMINGIITATEAKAAAMQDLHITDENGKIATGTTTDSVVLAVTQNKNEPTHAFAGTATTIGNAIGCQVYDAIYEVLGRED
ncbi:adenosylcobinamide amidohydrolase [Ectobacillus sp. sgz5001026]|uniref:adenosylcobinamide amidohydrolase n=1 Tax=Ectobacillus sp. sgz5001026 TaxID=3242473 RepID=UPI0036D2ABBB